MAKTNFNALVDEQKTVWSRDVWKLARNYSFVSKFTGKGANAMIQRITELTKSEKGTRAVMTLVADLETDGVAGDDQLEGNEEAIQAFDMAVQVDQIRQANRHKGRLADQKSVVNFREQSRDNLAYWLSDRIDQLAFLTMSGVGYNMTTRGAARTGSAFANLEFAADVTAPSSARHLRWDAANGLVAGDTTAVANGDTPSYKMLVEAKAYAKEHYIRGIKGSDGKEYYHVFMTPFGMSRLKLDSDYIANVRNAGVRGGANELFKGTDTIMVDGLLIHEFRHVYNTKGAASGSKWGGGTIDGQRVLFCGAQALGFVDLGSPTWIEKGFDYDNQQGISIAKMLGFKKPVWPAVIDEGDQDFGLLCIDTALNPA